MTTAAADDRVNPPANLGLIRLGLGFLQGLGLWGLHHAWEARAWPATELTVMSPLALLFLFVPLILIAGLGRMRMRTLLIWAAGAGAVLAGLGVYDALTATVAAFGERVAVSPVLVVCAAAGLFVAHNLVAAADHDRRPVAFYPTHFDTAWKHGVQLALSGAFVLAFWILLWLGATLFGLIGVEGFRKLIEQDWFAIPATFTAFAAAGHLTDVRVGLIRGVRAVALTLLSWLTPMMAAIAVAFLAALPFTGLEPLWETHAAAASLLAAAAVLIVLVNAIYQGGDQDDEGYVPPTVLRWSARAAGVVLVPIVGLAAYALSLRVGQYGLTPERIIAGACVLVGAVQAAGYFVAAVKPGPFMKLLEPTNVVGAYTTLAVLIALFTPIADPARLSVDDQVRRLTSGKVKPDRFDWDFLRFEAREYGLDALKRLTRNPDKAVADEARATLKREERRARAEAVPSQTLRAADLKVVTPGKALPADFLAQDWREDAITRCRVGQVECRVLIEDVTGDGVDDIVLVRDWGGGLFQKAEGGWRRIASVDQPCGDWQKALDEGRVETAPRAGRDIVIGGHVLDLDPDERCGPVATAAAAEAPVSAAPTER